jgi:hypothetical protein
MLPTVLAVPAFALSLAVAACRPDELDCQDTGTCPTAGPGGGGAGGAASAAGGDGGSGGAAAKKPSGEACGAAVECASGFCADAVCCDAACDAPCDACNLRGKRGTCTPLADGAAPAAPGCDGHLCDGASGCPTSCAGDADCTGGATCIPAPPDCTGKKCLPKAANGAACCALAADFACQSGHCYDDVCCDAPCSERCTSCKGAHTDAGTDGTCSPIKKGTDPDDECAAATCLSAGTCGAVQIAAGQSHTCAVLGDGTVRCWGFNQDGQLGDGTTVDKQVPTVVPGLLGATRLAVGANHTCVALLDGNVRCWGANYYGQLGDGTKIGKTTPVPLTTIASVAALAAGDNFTCALHGDGTAKCWGDNASGQLGDGTTVDKNAPVSVSNLTTGKSLTAAGGFFVFVDGKYYLGGHTCAVLADGTARCWGRNGGGQLGDGTTVDKSTPVAVSNLTAAVSISAGEFHTCATTGTGGVRCWGYNNRGQLGDGSTVGSTVPLSVTSIANAVGLAAGSFHTAAVLNDGSGRAWGGNASGQLGDGTTMGALTPILVSSLSSATSIVANWAHTCALLTDGSVRCWGANDKGQLGTGTTTGSLVPATPAGF